MSSGNRPSPPVASAPFPLSRKRAEGVQESSLPKLGFGIGHLGTPSARLRERGKGAEATGGEGPEVAIALGSNLGNREANLAFGRDELARRGVIWQAVSSLYQTEPVGPVADQPPFLNQVAVGATLLPPHALLEICLQVESERGRERTVHWGPRTLDLDVLLYGADVIDEPDLMVPHREMANRAFVLVPLAEIAGDWRMPGYNKSVRELLATVAGREGVRTWRSSDTK